MKLCAATVSCGSFEDLTSVFERHAEFLPKQTQYFLFTDFVEEHRDFLKKLNMQIEYVRTKLSCNSLHGYNILLTWDGESFWESFSDFDRVLIFQPDSGLLRHGIEEFYPYDFVGAPLPTDHIAYYPYCCNGGLSLRAPKVMRQIVKNYRWNADKGEDVYFCEMMNDHKMGNLAPRDVAFKFSCESLFQLGSLGYHKCWRYLTEEQWLEIKNQYKINS